MGINFSRLQDEKVGEFMSMMEDPIKSMKIEIVNSFYKKSYYGQYDADIAMVQILISLVPLPVMPLIAMDLDLKQVYFQHTQEKYRKSYYNFLHLVNVLVSDMTCYANVVVNKPDV